MIRPAGFVSFAALARSAACRLAGLGRVVIVLGAVVIGAACGGGGQGRRLAASCGLDCAADELRFALASSPRDGELYVALAEIEEQRGRPTAAIEALEAAEKLGRAFRGGLGGADRARLARLLVARARYRVAARRAGADEDVARARRLGADVPAELVRDAARIAVAHDLRHVDPQRRARGVKRLREIDPERAAALRGEGSALAIAETAAWLDEARAYRVLREMLDEVVRVRGVEALAEMSGAADRWLAARRWWRGIEGRPDLVTLERAVAAGASPCWYPRDPAACASPGPRARDLDAGVVGEVGLEVEGRAWPVVAARLAFVSGSRTDPGGRSPIAIDELETVAAAYTADPALADRRAEDAIARHVDVAAAAPQLARLFALLGDPARARRLWQRAFDASDEDADLALGLAIAMADAGDPAAGLQMMTRAAAGWGDAGAAMLHGARAFAAAGHTVDALTLVKAALGLSAPGDEAPAAALAAALLEELGRTADAAMLRALAAGRGAADGTDARAAVDAEVRAAGDGATRGAALARLAALATSADPSLARLAAAALRAQLTAPAAP